MFLLLFLVGFSAARLVSFDYEFEWKNYPGRFRLGSFNWESQVFDLIFILSVSSS